MITRLLSIILLMLTFSLVGLAQDEVSVSFEPAKYPVKRNDFFQLKAVNTTDQAVEVKIRLEVKNPFDKVLYSWLVPAYVIPVGTQSLSMKGMPNMTFTADNINSAVNQDKLSVYITTTVPGQYGFSEKTSIYRFPVQVFDFESQFSNEPYPTMTTEKAAPPPTIVATPTPVAATPATTSPNPPNQVTNYTPPVNVAPAPAPGAKSQLLAVPEKMNIFYLGVENPLSVSGADDFTTVSCDQPGINIRASGKTGQFMINLSIPGVYTLSIDNGTTRTQQSFQARRIPDPLASLSNQAGGNIGAEQFKQEIGVIPYLHNFDFDAKCQTTGFVLWRVQTNGTRSSAQNQGPRFSAETAQLIQLATPGDIYIFDNIRARCPGDVVQRQLSGMTFFVK